MKKKDVYKFMEENKELFEDLEKLEKQEATKTVADVVKAVKIRKCRKCTVDLPPTNYFHCNPCKVKIQSEEGSDDTL